MKKAFENICPPLYRDTDVTRLPMNARALQQILDWQYGPRGLLIHGQTGSGKTRAALLLIKRLLDEGWSVLAYDCVDFGHTCSRKFCDPDVDPSRWIGQLVRWDVLFLDDFGKARLTDRVESELFGLMEKRIANQKPTIITTNLTGDRLAKMMSPDRAEPMIRRLREFFIDVPVALPQKPEEAI